MNFSTYFRLSAVVAATSICCLLENTADAQIVGNLNIGRLNIEPWSDGGHAYHLMFPAGHWQNEMSRHDTPAFCIDEITLSTSTALHVQLEFGGSRLYNNPELKVGEQVSRLPVPLKLFSRLEENHTSVQARVIDPTIPTEQMVRSVRRIRTMSQLWTQYGYAMANRNHNQQIWMHYKADFDGIETELGGANKDSTIRIPSGQVLKMWHGLMSANFSGRVRNVRPGGSNIDDTSLLLERPSQLLTTTAVPRAAMLQTMTLSIDRDDQLLSDWNNLPLDDNGTPYVGPVVAKSKEMETGEFVGDDRTGFAILHTDKSGADATDFFTLNGDYAITSPSKVWHTRQNIAWFGNYSGWGGLEGYYSAKISPGIERLPWEQYFIDNGVSASTFTNAPAVADAERLGIFWGYLMGGPHYQTQGEDYDLVNAIAAVDYSVDEMREYGARYLRWLALNTPAGTHPVGEDAAHQAVTPLSNWEKFQLLWALNDSLQHEIDESLYAWHGGVNSGLTHEQKIAGLGLARMPDPPPTPNVMVAEGPSSVVVRAWYPGDTYFNDWDTGVDDFMGWRVYRKWGRPDMGNTNEIGSIGFQKWEMIGEVTAQHVVNGQGGVLSSGANKLESDHYNAEHTFVNGATQRVFEFYDQSVVKGQPYFYAVTAFDNGSQNTTGVIPNEPLESSLYESRLTSAQVSPFTPGLMIADSVLVVPNPWSLDAGAAKFPGVDPNSILFDKLPLSCTLKIFNESGDEIYTIDHGPGSRGYLTAQERWNQQSKSFQLVESGVYILAVINAKAVDPVTGDGPSIPNRFVKFAIIR